MTSSQPPDPRHLPSWQSAFAYPLPVVRGLETQLRKHVEDNKSKLRTLVGSRYRDLLGTAETIITMDAQMTLAEQRGSEIGSMCSLASIERKNRNYERFRLAEQRNRAVVDSVGRRKLRLEKEGWDGGRESVGVQAQIKILINCLSVAAKVVRSPVTRNRSEAKLDSKTTTGDALLAAEVLVLARLLLKSAEEGDQGMEKVELWEELRKRTLGLRKKLLAFIDRSIVQEWPADGDQIQGDEDDERLKREDERRDSMVNCLTAYALVTSSAPTDVLRYFLSTNGSHLTADFEGASPTKSELEVVLDRFGRTIADTKKIFPRLITESLSRVSKVPLLQDPQMTTLNELNLDVYGQWIPEDVRTFTPWVRHDELAQASVAEALKSWTLQAQKAIVGAVEEGLHAQTDAHVIVEMRSSILSQYFSIYAQNRGPRPAAAVNDLRRAFVKRLEELAVEQTAHTDLDLHSPGDVSKAGLWDLANMDLQMKKGAARLRSSILNRLGGQDPGLSKVIIKLDALIDSFDKLWEATMTMSAVRWDDVDLDEYADSEDTEVEIQDLLNKTDPQLIQKSICAAASESIDKLYQVIETASSEAITTPARLVRVLREVDERRLHLTDRVKNLQISFDAESLVKKLHTGLAQNVVEHVWSLQRIDSTLSAAPLKSLWDGTPSLPVQPDAQVFRLLMNLQRHMTSTGSDLWDPQAASAVKINLSKKISEQTQARLEGLRSMKGYENEAKARESDTESKDGAETSDQNGAKSSNDAEIQLIFDTLYLEHVLSTPRDGTSGLMNVVQPMIDGAGIDSRSEERLRKSAGEYWKRTYLLFGHLGT